MAITELSFDGAAVTASNPLPVTSPAGAATSAKAEDSAHANLDVGVAILAVRRDTAAVGSGTDGDYSTVNVDATGRLWANTELPDAAALADGAANPTSPIAGGAGLRFNETTWDRERGNTDITVLASAARTATLQSADFTNYNAKGLHLVIDVTASAATPSVVFTIQGKDSLSGKYYTILASSAITGTSTTVLKVYPGITAAANASVSDILPRVWRIDATHADGDSITYSVGASVIV